MYEVNVIQNLKDLILGIVLVAVLNMLLIL